MSAVDEERAAEMMMCCANCGKAAVDNVKLKICTACKLVKYCSVDCQKNHRPQHKKACKKRAAEIRDGRLFTQPDESNLGECPICCLPLSLDVNKSTISSCCFKYICRGCEYANNKREIEQGLEHKCPYCRELVPKTQEEAEKMAMKRVKANDPLAIVEFARRRHEEGDCEGAIECSTKAAELGDVTAHYHLSQFYHKGEGVEKDEKKEIHHLEEAAIGGHPIARFNLGRIEQEKGRTDRAYKHWIIAAKLGYDYALELVQLAYQCGQYTYVNKEDFEAALSGHQAAVDATKSEQREEAYAEYGI